MSLTTDAGASPAIPPSFDGLTTDAVLAETEEILQATSKLHDELVATISPALATFENVIRPIVDDENRAACRLVILSELLAQLSPDGHVREAARQAESTISDARVRNLMRHDIAGLVSAVYVQEASKPSGRLDAQDRHLLNCMYKKYRRSGADLQSNEERQRFRRASDELSAICAAAQDSLIEPETGIWFEEEDLVGVPEDVLALLDRDGTRVQVTFRRNHISAILRHATSSSVRQRLLVADRHRLPQNIERLSRAIELRDEIARLLGFEHHAALRIQRRMAPSVAYVQHQLEVLHTELKPTAQIEANRLLECKRVHLCKDGSGGNSVDQVYDWDKAFYNRLLKEDESTLDLSTFAEYFEVRHTAYAMLDLFCNIFGLHFETIEALTWHDSVMVLRVWDMPDQGGEFLGHLYLDLFHREGKYRGAHCILIQPGFLENDGSRHYPATALVCSYAAPSESRPTLLQHKEVVTMFHELGHAVHNLVSKTKYAIGRSRDYSEIPSIMLENWTWVPDVLVRLGRHFKMLEDPSTDAGILPRDMAEAICATRKSNRANAILAHVWPALFDLSIHTPKSHAIAMQIDTTELWNSIKQRITTTSSGDNPSDWGAGQARFIHMFRHNDAGYFSYPLSAAYAADLFASNFADDPLSPHAGRRWRYQVLEAGASLPEVEILRRYLGRDPNIKAIIHEIQASRL